MYNAQKEVILMRIKEVVAQTGLTDKTIRYYISKGLVFPNNNVSYSGRNSFDFTDDDVKTLNRIAVLRKAGFSVSQIESIRKSTNTKEEISSLLAEKEAEIVLDEKIIDALRMCNENGKSDFDSLADALESKLSEVEIVEEETGRISNIASVIVFSIITVLETVNLGYLLSIVFEDRKPFLYPYYPTEVILGIGIPVVLLIASIVFIIISYRMYLPSYTLVVIIITDIIVSVFIVLIVLFCDIVFLLSPGVGSCTNKVTNYTSIEDNIDNNMVCSSGAQNVFPQHINHKESKYHYLYLYNSVELFSEHSLTEEQYLAEKKRISSVKEIIGTKQRGEWTCIYYTDYDNEDADYHDVLLAAYNDKTKAVRYAYSYKFSPHSGTSNYYLSYAVKW